MSTWTPTFVPSAEVTLRPGRPADAEACGAICYQAFATISSQHGFPPDFPDTAQAVGLMTTLLVRDDVYSVVAERDDTVVGSNFLWEERLIAGVGPITIDPKAQNSTIGRRLMEDVLRRARERGFAGVRLCQAAYHNRSLCLYTKLGFDTREPLSVMQGAPLGVTVPGHHVRRATEADRAECNLLCLRVHGHERDGELRYAISEGLATVVERAGRITGYSTSVGFIGHTVGENDDDLKALIGAADAFPGPGFLLPTRNSDLMRWCLAQGLRVVMPMTLMTTGLYNEPAGAFLPSVIF